MNRSTVIIVAAGFGFALLAALLVQMIGGKKAPEAGEAARNISILVASRDIAVGDELGKTNMQWAPWPEDSKFAGAIIREGEQKPEDALKGRVRRGVSKGEPLRNAVVVEDTKGSFVAATISAGKRAVTVNVNAQSAVGGFINPGDAVDVILTYDVKVPNDDKLRKSAMMIVSKYSSETVLENLRVLAVDQDTKKTDAKIGKTVTLEASPREAETLALASKMGVLSLALRPLGDDRPAHPAGELNRSVTDIRTSGVLRELLKGENNAGSATQVVRVYTGTRVDNVEVRASTGR